MDESQPTEPLIRVRVRNTYFLPSIPNADWVMEVAEILETVTNLNVTGDGNYQTFEAVEFSFQNGLAHFSQTLQKNWNAIQSISFTATASNKETYVPFNKSVYLRVDCRFNSAETSLEIEANKEETVHQVLDTLEDRLKLEKFNNDLVGGQERRYHIQNSLDISWFEKVFSTLVTPNLEDYFSGTIAEKVKNQDAENGEIVHHFRSFDTFASQVRERHNTARHFSCWLSGRRSHVDFDIDPLRRLMRLKIEGWKDDAQIIFQKAEESLSLKRQIGEPYRYRKFAQTYKIIEWTSNKEFAAALEKVVQQNFLEKYGREPAVVDAFATTGKTFEDLHPFKGKLSEFLEWLAVEQRELRRVNLYLEGPMGKALGIFIDRSKKELRVASSFERTEFQSIVKTLRNAITTEDKPKESSTNGVEDDSNKKSIWVEKLWIPALATVLGIPATIFSTLFASQQLLFPLAGWKYELHLIPEQLYSSPIPGNQLNIEWKLKQPRLRTNPDASNQAATVQVRNESNEIIYPLNNESSTSSQGRLVLTDLPTGKYFILIETVDPILTEQVVAELLGDKSSEDHPEAENDASAAD
ncbi:MAG: hypothetical protein AAFZ17_06985 [Cyanobacteria bacterium J06650_10]